MSGEELLLPRSSTTWDGRHCEKIGANAFQPVEESSSADVRKTHLKGFRLAVVFYFASALTCLIATGSNAEQLKYTLAGK
jgi:hypothetical protein